MMVHIALVSMLASAPADSAPPPSTVVPAPAPAPVAAPAPAPTTTTTTTVVAPAPAPAPAPVSTTTVVSDDTTITTTSAGGSTTTTSVVVVSRPAPALPPPPRPVYAQVRPAPPIPHDPWRTQETIRTYRRRSVALLGLAGLGMAGTLGSQWLRHRDLEQCLSGPRGNPECDDADEMDETYASHGFMGSATFIVGTTWAGVLLGKAAATRDVLQRGRDPRPRPGLKLLGVVALGGATAWMIGANYTLLRHENACNGDHGCISAYRPLRWAANNGATLGFGLGAGLLGYGIAYERQGTAIMRVRATPSVAATQAGMAVTVEF